MTKLQIELSVFLFLFASMIMAQSSVPGLLNYQGRLIDGTNLVTGTVEMSIHLWNAPTGGLLPGGTDSGTVNVVDGLYSTYIGDNIMLGSLNDALNQTQVWIEVVVGTNVLSPREQLVSVPYAINAAQLDGHEASEFATTNMLPSGIMILTDSTNAPYGYTYSGEKVLLNGSDMWEFLPDSPMTSDGRLAAINGKIFTIGGLSRSAAGVGVTNIIEEYDPDNNIWSTMAPMPTARCNVTAVSLNGKLYVLGGDLYSDGLMTTVEVYDPIANIWTNCAEMPTLRSGFVAAAANNRIYLIGGYRSGWGEVSLVEEYDPVTDNWDTKTPMPAPRAQAVCGIIDEKIYVFGGITNVDSSYDYVYDPAFIYDPVTDAWNNSGAFLPVAIISPSAVSYNSDIFIYCSLVGSVTLIYASSTDCYSAGSVAPMGVFSDPVVLNGQIYGRSYASIMRYTPSAYRYIHIKN